MDLSTRVFFYIACIIVTVNNATRAFPSTFVMLSNAKRSQPNCAHQYLTLKLFYSDSVKLNFLAVVRKFIRARIVDNEKIIVF